MMSYYSLLKNSFQEVKILKKSLFILQMDDIL